MSDLNRALEDFKKIIGVILEESFTEYENSERKLLKKSLFLGGEIEIFLEPTTESSTVPKQSSEHRPIFELAKKDMPEINYNVKVPPETVKKQQPKLLVGKILLGITIFSSLIILLSIFL